MVKTAAMAAKIRPPDCALPSADASSTVEVRRPVRRMLGDPGQDVGQPGLRVDVVHFGGDDQAVHRRGALSAAVRRDLMMPGIWGARWRSHIHSIRYSAGLRS